jgi:hypothetical protein
MSFEAEVEPRSIHVPRWYWAVAVACLLFEMAGCAMYLAYVTTDPATLPLDQRRLAEAMPIWAVAAFAMGVWIGLAGAVGLLLRKRFARGALLVSLAFVIIQFGGLLLLPMVGGSTSSNGLVEPIVIGLIAYGFWQFSLIADRKDWIE